MKARRKRTKVVGLAALQAASERADRTPPPVRPNGIPLERPPGPWDPIDGETRARLNAEAERHADALLELGDEVLEEKGDGYPF